MMFGQRLYALISISKALIESQSDIIFNFSDII